MEEILYAYWLSITDGIGNATVKTLLECYGSYEDIWKDAVRIKDCSKPGLTLNTYELLESTRDEDNIRRSYENMLNSGIRFLHFKHPDYPARLKSIYNAPAGLYVKGSLPNPEGACIAIVGARNCSEYGRYVTNKLASALAKANVQIISGMARGIDGIAQRAAADAGGYSCAVLGCGVDICYPPENRDLYDDLCISGGIISEYHPGTEPVSGLFPQRNRIISGLSDIVVLIEARERSGSLITADLALEQGRDVYALPGRVTDALSHGTNRLIRQGAGIILSPEEFIRDLNETYSLPKDNSPAGAADVKIDMFPDLSREDKKVLNAMDYNPKSIKNLQEETHLDSGTLFGCLMKLSVKGLILQKGSHYVLSGG